MRLPQHVKNCIDALEVAGFSAYAVGGAVRDGLLGLEPSDWDVTTSARPDEILRVFESERTIPTGIKHGTITVLVDTEGGERAPIEITTFRIDGEYKDSRHPESVEFSADILDDLSRRDFTVNAMAFNEKQGIIDGFGGISDLENKVIRAVGNPQKRFTEDALRIVRAFRFSAQLGFEIEPNTLEGAYSCAHLLKNIARERIGVEFKKLLASKGVLYALEKMIDGNVWGKIFDIDAPDMSVVSSLLMLESNSPLARLTILIAQYTETQKNNILDGLRLSNAEKKLACRLVSVKNFEIDGQDVGVVARRFLHYFDDVFELAFLLLRFYNTQCEELFEEICAEKDKKRVLNISSLALKGNDLLPLCESDYKKVGILLNELVKRVIENPELNEKETLILIAKNIIETK